MGDMGDTYRAMRQEGQQRRAHNRKCSAEILEQRNVKFESKNGGAHLILKGPKGFIDFWPGTGRWVDRNGKRGFGIRKLLRHLNVEELIIPWEEKDNGRTICQD